jgi:hypothetical protein
LDSDTVRSKNNGLLACLLGGLDPQFAAALGGGVRLGGQRLRVQDGGLAAVARRAAELGAVRSSTLAEQQVIRFALDPLTIVEAQRFGTGAPPATRRFTSALAPRDERQRR